ncbi:MAG: hypothetical protein AB1489_33005 [Acidobacteriota bacterium]
MVNESEIPNIKSTYVVFDNKGKATPIAVTETFWQDLTSQFGNFAGRILVSCFSFEKDWDSWEAHPQGDEFVCLLSGDIEFLLEVDGVHRSVRINNPGSFIIIPRSTWHTARVLLPTTALFVTPGEGTQIRSIGENPDR